MQVELLLHRGRECEQPTPFSDEPGARGGSFLCPTWITEAWNRGSRPNLFVASRRSVKYIRRLSMLSPGGDMRVQAVPESGI